MEEQYNAFWLRAHSHQYNPRLENLHQSLDHFYLTKKLKFACVALVQQQVTGKGIDLSQLEIQLAGLLAGHPSLPRLPQLYLLAYRTLSNKDAHDTFRNLVALLLEPVDGRHCEPRR